MKKFYTLVKKEIRELLTPQMIIPLLAVVVVFMFIGKVAGKQAAQSAQKSWPVALLDLDNTEASKNLAQALSQSRLDITAYNDKSTAEQTLEAAKKDNKKSLVVIPKGYGENLASGLTTPLPTYTIMENFSFLGSRGGQAVSAAIAGINEKLSVAQITKLAPSANPNGIKQPILSDDYVIVGNRQAHVSPASISGFISSQTTFIPIILFLVIVMASQLIAVSIATEKENKTLETLLSSPVSRQSIVAAKLVAAGLVALCSSAIYLVGMRSYLTGLSGPGGGTDNATHEAARQLGLALGSGDYIMLGLSLFFGILAALSIALILGSFAQDAKSAQGVITPLMMLILIPYFLTMFLDINALSPALRYVVLAIPFAHPFLAAPNLMLHHPTQVWLGIGYMALFFLVFVFLAAKLFASDKILTLNLNFKKK